MDWIYCIICDVLEIARRLWQIFFSAFIALVVGIVPLLIFVKGIALKITLIVMSVLALICLAIAVITFICDFKNTWEKEHPEKMRERANERMLCERYPTMFKKKRS
jgi:hypothetical protein